MAAKKSAEKFSPLKTGADPRTEEKKSNNWLKIDPNTQLDVVILIGADEIISCEQCAIWLEEGNSPVWPYLGPSDPSHELKVDKRYKAFLPVLQDGEPKVWPMGKGAHTQVLDIDDATGDIKGLEIRIKRQGAGLATRYSVTPTGKRKKVDTVPEVDVISMLGPLTVEDAQNMIAERLGLGDYEEVLDRYRGKTITRAPKKAKVAPVRGNHLPSNPVEEEEDEDLELETEEEEDDEIELI